jgi:predicted nucleotidyltransferase
MPETLPIDIRPDLWAIVSDILHQHVPGHEVWTFGSRARRQAKRYSDLDLAVISDTPLAPAISTALTDAFSESDLPWRVDVLDWATTQPEFRAIIERDKVLLQRAGPGNPRDRRHVSPGMSTKEPEQPNAKSPTPPIPPGGAAALPEGSLPKPFLGPQGDENRAPPANAPAPVAPTETVTDIDDKA